MIFSLLACKCVLYIYKDGTLWWSIYRMLTGHMSIIFDLLVMYSIHTMADACAYMDTFMLITTHSILLLLTKNKKQNN